MLDINKTIQINFDYWQNKDKLKYVRLANGHYLSLLDLEDDSIASEVCSFIDKHNLHKWHHTGFEGFKEYTIKYYKHFSSKKFNLGLRNLKTDELVACITGIPIVISHNNKIHKTIQVTSFYINHKVKAAKVELLFREFFERYGEPRNKSLIIFTTATPGSAKVGYYKKFLNPRKIRDTSFAIFPEDYSYNEYIRDNYIFPCYTSNLSQMTECDIEKVNKLLNDYLSEFDTFQVFSKKEVKKMFLPQKDFIHTYVVEDPLTEDITDIILFYELQYYIKDKNNRIKYGNYIKVGVLYYYICTDTEWEKLLSSILYMCKNNGFDCFKGLDAMDNDFVYDRLGFSGPNTDLTYLFVDQNGGKVEFEPNSFGITLM